MPHIKEISKCRRIPKEKQSSGSGESIDDENTELDDDFVKMRKLFRESQDQKFIRRLKKKLKENLLKQQDGDSSGNELPNIEYPEPLPKIDRNKKTRAIELNSIKKSVLGGHFRSKKKPPSTSLKKMEDLGKTTIDTSNNNAGVSLNSKSAEQSQSVKKDDKSTKYDKKNDKPKKKRKGTHDFPLTKTDRDLTKNEVEAMIRTVLKQSREDAGIAEDIEDVSLGETESTPSDEELDIGKDPEMSSTPDDVSSETLSDEVYKNFVY